MRRRLIRYVAIVVVAPLAGQLVVKAADKLEEAGGRSLLTGGLRRAGSLLTDRSHLRRF